MRGFKRTGRIAVAFACLFSANLLIDTPTAQAGRYSAIIVDAATGRVLHAEEPDALRYPASLTKMMTLYLTFDALKSGRLSLDQPLRVSAHAASQAPSVIGVSPGGLLTVRQAIMAVVTKSANDAAEVLGENIGGNDANFANMMTAKARALGMSHTTFRNANGLPNPAQRTTARDMATLALAILRNHRDQYHWFSTAEFTYNGRSFANHNHLLDHYEGADGFKTGYINASGFNLVASAQRDGRRLVGVVFGGTSVGARDNRMENLLDVSFARGSSPSDEILTASNDGGSRPALRLPSLIAKAEAATPVPTKVALRRSKNIAAAPMANAEQGDTTEPKVKAHKLVPGAAWGVQIGAFSQASKAEHQANAAAAIAPSLLNGREIAVSPTAGSNPVYRARLLGFSQSEAKSACQTLKRHNFACSLVTPQQSAGI